MFSNLLLYSYALERGIPIMMLLSGGYQKTNAAVIADSIVNLDQKLKIFTMKQTWSNNVEGSTTPTVITATTTTTTTTTTVDFNNNNDIEQTNKY